MAQNIPFCFKAFTSAMSLMLAVSFSPVGHLAYADIENNSVNDIIEVIDASGDYNIFDDEVDLVNKADFDPADLTVSIVSSEADYPTEDAMFQELSEDVFHIDYDFSPFEIISSKTPAIKRFDRVDFQQVQPFANSVYENLLTVCSFDNDKSIHNDSVFAYSKNDPREHTLTASSEIGDFYKTKNESGILVGKYFVKDIMNKKSFSTTTYGKASCNAAIAIAHCVAQCFEEDYPDLTFDFRFHHGRFITVTLQECGQDGIMGLVWVGASNGFPSGWEFNARKQAYSNGEDDIRSDYAKMQDNISALVNQASALDSDYKKLSLFNDWLLDNNTYSADVDDPIAHTITSALAGAGDPVCQAYADAFYVLCRESNISCATIIGEALGGKHEWNVVKIDDAWYLIDVTWNDSVYEANNDELSRRTWFLIGSEHDNGNHVSCDDSWGTYWYDDDMKFKTLTIFFGNHPIISNDDYIYAGNDKSDVEASNENGHLDRFKNNEITSSAPVDTYISSTSEYDSNKIENSDDSAIVRYSNKTVESLVTEREDDVVKAADIDMDVDTTPVPKAMLSDENNENIFNGVMGWILFATFFLASCMFSLVNAKKERLF